MGHHISKLFSVALSAGLILLLAACGGGGGGGTAGSANDVPEIRPNEQLVMGYWTPRSASNQAYEFFPSPTESPYNVQLKTGRILSNGRVVNPFFWSIQLNGTIVVNAVDPNCLQRPLNRCPVVKSSTIVASGDSVQDSTWTISWDTNADGITDEKVMDTYHRAEINLSGLASGEFFLTHSNNRLFDTPVPGTVSGGAMSIRLDDFEKPVTVTAASFASDRQSVDFSGGEGNAVVTDEEFFVNGMGYVDIPVKQWYDNIKLSASAGGEYSLSYEMHRKVQIPSDIDSSMVELKDFETLEKRSTVVAVLNDFSSAISVQAPEKFYISLELDTFFNSDAGNELNFTSNLEGTVSYTLPHHAESPAEVRNFIWVKRSDGAIVLNFAGYGDVIMRAIKPINGGYQVLYSLPSEDYGTTYRIRDLVKDGSIVLNEQTIPGRYKFTSISPLPNGSHEYEVTFHADKTVTGFVGGYWFQDVNGDIVSYECTLAGGKKGTTYEECAGGLDDPSLVTFSHVRRIRFMHQDGNNFQSRYTGSIFQDEDDDFTTFALTYRWVRVGGEVDEDDD